MMHPIPNHHPSHRNRGVAMLLVLISLMMATILTTAYLASRDNSAAIGSNVASAAAARWTANSGLDFGVAILETNATWRTSHVGGRLLSNYAMAGGTFDLDLQDIATGLPPTALPRHWRRCRRSPSSCPGWPDRRWSEPWPSSG